MARAHTDSQQVSFLHSVSLGFSLSLIAMPKIESRNVDPGHKILVKGQVRPLPILQSLHR
jgi:hypothetical protein